MTGPALTAAAAGLLRALVARSGAGFDRILLNDARSTKWHSLTFDGERHHFTLRIVGPHAEAFAARMTDRLEDADFSIPALLVADIALSDALIRLPDGSVELAIEALTVDAA
jgi:hypothetical protein